MFTFIIIVLVVAFAIGFLKNLNAQERAIVMSRTLNAAKYGVTGAAKITRSTVKATYQSGQLAGIEMAINGQDTLKSMDNHNKDVQSRGGAVKIAVEDVNTLSARMGLDSVNKDLADKIAERKAVLDAKRAELNANFEAAMAL